jgi:hypothetical protein
MSPTPRHRGPVSEARRVPLLVGVLAVLVAVGLVAHFVGRQASPAASSGPGSVSGGTAAAASISPAGAESSSWYCTGGSGSAGGAASAVIYLVNSTDHPVTGTMTVVSDAGASAKLALSVPARSQVRVIPSEVEQGTWLAARVDLAGGGVAVTEAVSGPVGWSEAPCASSIASNWYFASGSTANGSDLYVSLYNPTATEAVVNLSFGTAGGLAEPQPFQGLVLQPGQLVVAGVASYVQNQPSVSTIVQAQSGEVVAAELQVVTTSTASGLSLRLGAPAPARQWTFPRSVNVGADSTSFVVFNPTASPAQVVVRARLQSGPVTPFTQTVPAFSTWTIKASQATRLPDGSAYAATVTASGGPGVVVDRIATAPSGAAAPQFGAVAGLSGVATHSAGGRWIVSSPSTVGVPSTAGASPYALAVASTQSVPVTVRVFTLTPAGLVPLAGVGRVVLGPEGFVRIGATQLAGAGADPLVVEANASVAVSMESLPQGMPGVVSLNAVGFAS